MAGNPVERLQWKEPLHSLEVELQQEFGLSPISAKALVSRIAHFLDTLFIGPSESRQPGQISYCAVAVSEPAGKPLRHCLTLPVSLTLLHSKDANILHELGSPALRRTRVARLCHEAASQGAALSHEDLSLLLGIEASSIRRIVADCTKEGSPPPTRGLLADIGPTLSHKEQIVSLYFRGFLPDHIAARTAHSLGSVERYLADFARVLALHQRVLPVEVICRVTGMSPTLVKRYLELIARFNQPVHRSIIARLLTRFGPLHEEDANHG
jgi:hypothetical protein